MTTQSDDSSRTDQTAASERPDAVREAARVTKGKKGARVAKEAPRITQVLPAVHLEPAPHAQALAIGSPDEPDEPDDGATREVPAISAGSLTSQPAQVEASDPAHIAAEPLRAADDDPDATIMRQQHRPTAASADQPVGEPVDEPMDQPMTEPVTPRPRYNTLAGAFNRSRASASDPAAPTGRPSIPSEPIAPASASNPPSQMSASTPPADIEDFIDEVDDSEDEWALADQPTVQWTPQQIQQMQQVKPDFLQTGEQASWPPRPGAAPRAPESDASHHDWRTGLPPRPQPPFPMHGAPRPPAAGEQRLATPDGRLAPEPLSASTAGAQPDPRMERFQELRRQRFAHGQGERTDADPPPMADAVRQWWSDLRPGLQHALNYQREVRASGMHPIPAYEVTPTSRLGDAFGRLAASARELSERAQQAAGPTIKRIHDQVEQAAQGIISRFEGDTVRQQAPLLGPGRIAIFFRHGVTVGQAQRLLAASAARPMRLIPRKHGFLARVQPGKEAEVCERLRLHPYVSDVVYLEFNEYGEPVGGRR